MRWNVTIGYYITVKKLKLARFLFDKNILKNYN